MPSNNDFLDYFLCKNIRSIDKQLLLLIEGRKPEKKKFHKLAIPVMLTNLSDGEYW